MVPSLPLHANSVRQLQALSAELEPKFQHVPKLRSLKDVVHVPDIVHSTVMRPGGASPDERALAEGLDGLRKRWRPASVRVGEVFLVHEKHPYMHVAREEGEVHRFTLG